MSVPLCPVCQKNPCVWSDKFEDWAICPTCDLKNKEEKRRLVEKHRAVSIGFPSKYYDFKPNAFQLEFLGKLSKRRGFKIVNPKPVGKTTLLRLIQREALNRGRSALYYVFTDLPEIYINRSSGEWNQLFHVDVLLIDDFGLPCKLDWFIASFHGLLSHRRENEKHTSFVVRDFGALGKALESEIKGMTL